jgi:hypothetical protein
VVNVAEQDACAIESMRPVYDRTKEHPGTSDKRSSPCAGFFSKRSEKFSKAKSRRTWCEIPPLPT